MTEEEKEEENTEVEKENRVEVDEDNAESTEMSEEVKKTDMEDVSPQADSSGLLVPLDEYLSNGVHVGLKYKTKDMMPFIYKVRPDKLCVFDVQKIDERIRIAVNFISQYAPEDVLVVSNRMYGRTPIQRFSDYTGIKAFAKHWVCGTLTNPLIDTYTEAKLLIVTDPSADQQAMAEASKMGMTILALCDTNTRARNIDFILPCNNKGKNSLALIYWILTKELLKKRGIENFNEPLESFISKAEPQPYLLEMQEQQRARRAKARKRRKKK